MMHPHTALRFISEAVGHGVVATRDLPAGTITWVQDELDREFTPERVATLGAPYAETLDKYCFRNRSGSWVLCWDHAKYVNHSFRSNCISTAYNFEIAVRDIYVGEELTNDYGYLNVDSPFEAIDEGAERTVVYPDDLTRIYPVWDKQLRDAWPLILERDQPLRRLLTAGMWRRIGRIARGEAEMASILECYCGDAFGPPSTADRANGKVPPTGLEPVTR